MAPLEQRKRTRQSGFTLLEILLAISITGIVLAAAASLVVSVSTIWIDRQERTFFADHVDGVTEFVQSCFSRAGSQIGSPAESEIENPGPQNPDQEMDRISRPTEDTPDEGDSSESGSTALLSLADDPVGWARPPGFSDFQDPLINFQLNEAPPLLINADNSPIVSVDLFLHHTPDDGLSLLWYSLLQEKAEEETDLRRTLISPYVTSLIFIYWDESFERWEEEREPREGGDGEFLLPRFIKIEFEYAGETKSARSRFRCAHGAP